MKHAAFLALPCLAVACCAPVPEPERTATPAAAAPVSAPVPPPTVTLPTYDNWMDAPRTPGDWSYRTDGSGTMASYGPGQGEPSFALRCDPRNDVVSVVRMGRASGPVPMRIRTESTDRMLTARQIGDQLPALRVDLPARDSLLEAMAFSKGRFAVEAQGLETLYLPAWPEVTRVIEDCR